MELSLLLDKIDFYIAKARNETYFEHLSMIENSARKYLRRSLPFLKRWKQLIYTKNISKDSNNLTMITCLMNVWLIERLRKEDIKGASLTVK